MTGVSEKKRIYLLYIDGYLNEANTKEIVVELCDNLQNVLQSGGFDLRKWIANDLDLLHD